MPKSHSKSAAIAVCTMLVGGAVSGSTFAMQPLSQGYMLSAQDAAAPRADQKANPQDSSDKRAEGRDSARKGKTESNSVDPAPAQSDAKTDDKAAKDKTGTTNDSKSHIEGKCGEGKCGAAG